FPLGKYTFGVLVCYEDTDMYLGREYGVETRDGPPVDFILNISNDGWFDGTQEHEEHLAIARFRAVETRRAVAPAANQGVSALIDSNGRVLAPTKIRQGQYDVWLISKDQPAAELQTGEWHDYKQTDGILVADIPIDRRTTLYAIWGDWLPICCWVMLGVGLVWTWRRPRQVAA